MRRRDSKQSRASLDAMAFEFDLSMYYYLIHRVFIDGRMHAVAKSCKLGHNDNVTDYEKTPLQAVEGIS